MRLHHFLIWAVISGTALVALAAAALSPLLAWRAPVYILGGFAGIAAMILLLLQPLLVGGALPPVTGNRRRVLHQRVGIAALFCVLIHIGALYITSPPDVIDALLFRAPAAFSAWGTAALLALLSVATLGLLRQHIGLRPKLWRRLHMSLALVLAGASALHALLIIGTMETISKWALCLLLVGASLWAIRRLRL